MTNEVLNPCQKHGIHRTLKLLGLDVLFRVRSGNGLVWGQSPSSSFCPLEDKSPSCPLPLGLRVRETFEEYLDVAKTSVGPFCAGFAQFLGADIAVSLSLRMKFLAQAIKSIVGGIYFVL